MFWSDMPRPLDWIVGGWQIAGLVNFGTGRPYTFYSGLNTVSQAVQSTVNCNSCPRDLGQLAQLNGIPVWLTPDQLDKCGRIAAAAG